MTTALERALRLARALLATAIALLAAPSAIGLLYLLRQDDAPQAGPSLRGALPLQQLAGGDTQSLLRIAVASLAAGAACGILLALVSRARVLLLALATAATSFVVLVLTGAASDAIANAYRFADRLSPQFHHRGLWAETALLLIGTLCGAAAARGTRRPSRAAAAPLGHRSAEHTRAAELVATYGRDSLDPFALRDDKSFHFSGDGMVAYRLIGRTAVVSGDPIGPPEQAAATMRDFARTARRNRWGVVATGVSPAGLEALRGCGFHALQLGVEAVVDPARFTLEGRPVRKLRQSVRRATRLGWEVEVVAAEALDDERRAGIAAVERRWRAGQPRLQGFAMALGRLWGRPEDDDGTIYAIARDPAGEIASFLRFAACRDGLSLDAMRRAEGAPNGLCDAMVAAVLEHARERGLTQVSLNFAGFGHVMAAPVERLSARERLLRSLLRRTGDRFQLERLVRANEKFGPAWRPRYLLYRHRLTLPLAGLRVLQAEAYLPHPLLALPRRRGLPAPGVATPVPATAPAPTGAAAAPAPTAAPPLLSPRPTTAGGVR